MKLELNNPTRAVFGERGDIGPTEATRMLIMAA
jgi:hypothetical protein